MLVHDPKICRSVIVLRVACPAVALACLGLCALALVTHHYFLACVDAFSCGVGTLNTMVQWTFFQLAPKESRYVTR